MEQNMRFGPVGDTEKKNWGRLRATFEAGFFHGFVGTKNVNFFLKTL